LACVICGSKEYLIQHHKVHPVVRDASDETIPVCYEHHNDIHGAYHDDYTKHIKISCGNVDCFIYLVHNPRKWFDVTLAPVPGGRPKKGTNEVSRRNEVLRRIKRALWKREIAFYWAIYNYSYVDVSGGVGAINRSRNIISLPRRRLRREPLYDDLVDDFVKSGEKYAEVSVEGKKSATVLSALRKRAKGKRITVRSISGKVYLKKE